MKSISPLKLAVLFLVLAFGSTGCVNHVTDTEGRVFSFDCKSGKCSLTQLEGKSEMSTEGSKQRVNHDGRILQVCPQKDDPFSCRVIKCDGSRVCSALGGQEFICEKGICQAPSREMADNDRLALCLAGTGAWKPTPDQLELLTLTRACQPPNCVVPHPCLKP